jgi:Ca2+-binding EF-hand superfamily protein
MNKFALIMILGLSMPLANAGQAEKASDKAGNPSFSSVDSDQDGMISREEAASFSAVELAFDKADANQDGALDADEFSQTGAAAEAEAE